MRPKRNETDSEEVISWSAWVSFSFSSVPNLSLIPIIISSFFVSRTSFLSSLKGIIDSLSQMRCPTERTRQVTEKGKGWRKRQGMKKKTRGVKERQMHPKRRDEVSHFSPFRSVWRDKNPDSSEGCAFHSLASASASDTLMMIPKKRGSSFVRKIHSNQVRWSSRKKLLHLINCTVGLKFLTFLPDFY